MKQFLSAVECAWR